MRKTVNRWLSLSLALLLVFSLLGPLPQAYTAQTQTATEEVYRKPLTQGVQNIVKRAYQMTDIQWTPKKNVFGWKEEMVYFAGVTYKGLPYGQPVYEDYVPYDTSLAGFIAKVNDASSKMYTSRSKYVSAPYYSTDCSAFVAWAWGISSRQTTRTLYKFGTKITADFFTSAEVGDILCLAGSHVVLLTDVTYDAAGKINGIEISEATTDYLTNYCCRRTRYGVGGKEPLETIQKKYLDEGYILYRCDKRNSVTYTHSCVVPLPGDTCASCADICLHKSYDEAGNCAECGQAYPWFVYTPEAGIYQVKQSYAPRISGPYAAASQDVPGMLQAGCQVTVAGSLVNAHGEEWYCVQYGEGMEGYVPATVLNFVEYLPSSFRAELQTPRQGDKIPKSAYAVLGNVYSSRYPLEYITAYLDGEYYAGWKADGLGTLAVSLGSTNINNDLNFAKLSSGTHTLILRAKDRMHDSSVIILRRTFTIKSGADPLDNVRVMFYANGGNCAESIRGVAKGTAVGELPVPTRAGYSFEGWYTALTGGTQVTAATTISKDTALYARWKPLSYTVNFYFGDDPEPAASILLGYGKTIPMDQLPKLLDDRYLITGWYTALEGGHALTEEMAVVGDMNIYARLKRNYCQVYLDANGGTVDPQTVNILCGGTYGNLPAAVRNDFIFAGWVLMEEDGWQRIQEDTALSTEEDHTLTAQWAKAVWETEGGKLYFDPDTGMIVGCDGGVTVAVIPEQINGVTVTGIAEKAFRDCPALTQVQIPKTVTVIEDWAFWNCPALSAIYVDEENEVYSHLQGVLTNKSQTTLLRCPPALSGEYDVPEGILIVAEHAFYDCSQLEVVLLSTTVNHVASNAFYGCELAVLEENPHFSAQDGVLFSKDMTVLVWYPRNRTGVYTVPEGVTTVGVDAFRECRIEAVVLPESLQLIQEGAFAQCGALKDAYFDGNAPQLEENAFEQSMIVLNYCEWNTGWTSPIHEGYASYMYLRTVPDAITSEVFSIADGVLRGVAEGTTVEQLLAGIYKSEFVRAVRDGQAVSKDTVVGTGLVLELVDGDTIKDTVVVVIRGDVSGDGRISVTDMVAVKRHILKKRTLTGAAALAADTSANGNITITDFVQIKAHILRKTLIVQ